MMLAPKDDSRYIKSICIKDYTLIDKVYGNCSVIKGETYDVIPDVDGFVLVKFGYGLCPYKSEYFKSIVDIRDEKLINLIKNEKDKNTK